MRIPIRRNKNLKKRTRNKVINREGKIPLWPIINAKRIDGIIVTHRECHAHTYIGLVDPPGHKRWTVNDERRTGNGSTSPRADISSTSQPASNLNGLLLMGILCEIVIMWNYSYKHSYALYAHVGVYDKPVPLATRFFFKGSHMQITPNNLFKG